MSPKLLNYIFCFSKVHVVFLVSILAASSASPLSAYSSLSSFLVPLLAASSTCPLSVYPACHFVLFYCWRSVLSVPIILLVPAFIPLLVRPATANHDEICCLRNLLSTEIVLSTYRG
jgi:hypothetical protein